MRERNAESNHHQDDSRRQKIPTCEDRLCGVVKRQPDKLIVLKKEKTADALPTPTAVELEIPFPIVTTNGDFRMDKPNHEPSLEEIAKVCEEIRKDWDEDTHWRRRGYPDGKPELTVMRCRLPRGGKRLA